MPTAFEKARSTALLLFFVVCGVLRGLAEGLEAEPTERVYEEYFPGEAVASAWGPFATGDYRAAVEALRTLDAEFDRDASLLWGLVYDLGLGVEREAARAEFWYERSARLGLKLATLAVTESALSDRSREGYLRANALRFARRAILGEADGIKVGRLLLGDAETRALNLLEAIRYNRALALSQGKAWAVSNVARLLEDPANAYSLNAFNLSRVYGQKAADLGAGAALDRQALAYRRGLGVEESSEQAVALYREATELGRLDSALALGKMLVRSESPSEKQEGLAILERAAAEDPDEMHDLAELYHDGDKIAKDLEKARELYQRAADAGDAHAASELGRFLENGWAGPSDSVSAERYFQLAASRGSYWGTYNLGRVLVKGAIDAAEAAKGMLWLKQAALLENDSAIDLLIKIYSNGNVFTPKNRHLANFWVDWAVAHDNQTALVHQLFELNSEYNSGAKSDSELEDRIWQLGRRSLALGDAKAALVLMSLTMNPRSRYHDPYRARQMGDAYNLDAESMLRSLYVQVVFDDAGSDAEALGWRMLDESPFALDDLMLAHQLAYPSTMREGFMEWLGERANAVWAPPLFRQFAGMDSLEDVYAEIARQAQIGHETGRFPVQYDVDGRRLVSLPRFDLRDTILTRYAIELSARCVLHIVADGTVGELIVQEPNHPLAKKLFSRARTSFEWEPAKNPDAESKRIVFPYTFVTR